MLLPLKRFAAWPTPPPAGLASACITACRAAGRLVVALAAHSWRWASTVQQACQACQAMPCCERHWPVAAASASCHQAFTRHMCPDWQSMYK